MVYSDHLPNKQPQHLRTYWNPGGMVGEFYKNYSKGRRDGTTYVIDGPCISACTFALYLLPKEQVCATDYATFGFHSAWYEEDGKMKFDADFTTLIFNSYPAELQQMLRKRGWNGGEHSNLVWIKAQDMRSIIRTCD